VFDLSAEEVVDEFRKTEGARVGRRSPVGAEGDFEGACKNGVDTAAGRLDGRRTPVGADGDLEGACDGVKIAARLLNVMLPRPVAGSQPTAAVKPDEAQQVGFRVPAQHLLEPEVMSVNLAALA